MRLTDVMNVRRNADLLNFVQRQTQLLGEGIDVSRDSPRVPECVEILGFHGAVECAQQFLLFFDRYRSRLAAPTPPIKSESTGCLDKALLCAKQPKEAPRHELCKRNVTRARKSVPQPRSQPCSGRCEHHHKDRRKPRVSL